jgi:tRNA threonylcarbamoyladenosine biosynthesis protein TsaB
MEARLVCFETSGAFGGIAFLLGKKTWEIKFSADKSHSSHLFRFLPLIFQSNPSEGAFPTPFPLEEVDYFVVDVGPGSFTGLRVGLSLVKALTLVHEKPVIPISSLEVLSFGYGCPELPILSLVDAYTGEVFAGMYRWEKGRLTTLLEPCLLRLEELESLIQERTLIVSETLEKWKDYLIERLSHKVVFPSNPVELSAYLLGRLAMLKLSQGEAKVLSGDEVLPLYLKPSQAERKRA